MGFILRKPGAKDSTHSGLFAFCIHYPGQVASAPRHCPPGCLRQAMSLRSIVPRDPGLRDGTPLAFSRHDCVNRMRNERNHREPAMAGHSPRQGATEPAKITRSSAPFGAVRFQPSYSCSCSWCAREAGVNAGGSPAGAIRRFSTADRANCVAARRGGEQAWSRTGRSQCTDEPHK